MKRIALVVIIGLAPFLAGIGPEEDRAEIARLQKEVGDFTKKLSEARKQVKAANDRAAAIERENIRLKEIGQPDKERLLSLVCDAVRAWSASGEQAEKLAHDSVAWTQSRKRLGLDHAARMAKAIESHKLIVGMTYEDAAAALGSTGKEISADNGGETWEWRVILRDRRSVPRIRGYSGPDTPGLMRIVTARFENGKLVSFEDDTESF